MDVHLMSDGRVFEEDADDPKVDYEPGDVAWFEEPLKPDALEDYVLLRQNAPLPIAGVTAAHDEDIVVFLEGAHGASRRAASWASPSRSNRSIRAVAASSASPS